MEYDIIERIKKIQKREAEIIRHLREQGMNFDREMNVVFMRITLEPVNEDKEMVETG